MFKDGVQQETQSIEMTPEKVLEIFKKISDEECEMMGMIKRN